MGSCTLRTQHFFTYHHHPASCSTSCWNTTHALCSPSFLPCAHALCVHTPSSVRSSTVRTCFLSHDHHALCAHNHQPCAHTLCGQPHAASLRTRKKGDYAHQNSPHLAPTIKMINAIKGGDGDDDAKTKAETRGGTNESAHPTQTKKTRDPPPTYPVRDLPVLRIDPAKIATNGGSSGGDMAVRMNRSLTSFCSFTLSLFQLVA
jgi:hypothetical protein